MSGQLSRDDLINCLFEPEDLVELRAFSGTRGQGGLGIVLPTQKLVQSGRPWIKQQAGNRRDVYFGPNTCTGHNATSADRDVVLQRDRCGGRVRLLVDDLRGPLASHESGGNS